MNVDVLIAFNRIHGLTGARFRSKVDDNILVSDKMAYDVAIADILLNAAGSSREISGKNGRWAVYLLAENVEYRDVISSCRQCFGQSRADETGTACNEDFHGSRVFSTSGERA